jgi:hypothetical protein
MGLKETVSHLKSLLHQMDRDLDKGMGGNKAASQRVRIHSIKFSKIAKTYRKESLAQERKEAKKVAPKSKKKSRQSKKR